MASLKAEIKEYNIKRKAARDNSKVEMDKHAYFNRAAKPYLDAERLIKQQENYSRFDEIANMYDEAKLRHEKKLADDAEEAERLRAEEKALAAQIKAEKAQKKLDKKNKK